MTSFQQNEQMRKQLKKKVDHVYQPMIMDLLIKKPQDCIQFMIEWLQTRRDYLTDGTYLNSNTSSAIRDSNHQTKADKNNSSTNNNTINHNNINTNHSNEQLVRTNINQRNNTNNHHFYGSSTNNTYSNMGNTKTSQNSNKHTRPFASNTKDMADNDKIHHIHTLPNKYTNNNSIKEVDSDTSSVQGRARQGKNRQRETYYKQNQYAQDNMDNASYKKNTPKSATPRNADKEPINFMGTMVKKTSFKYQ